MKALVLEATWSPRPEAPAESFDPRTRRAQFAHLVWRHPRVELRSVLDPTPRPHEVVLRVRACGICGSDLHLLETDADGYTRYPGLTRLPVILGHEFAGEVVEVGREVQGLRVGDRVAVEQMVWCGACDPCRMGFPNHCVALEEIGFTVDGAYAEYIAVPERQCWRIDALLERYPEATAWELAATCEPTAVAYHALFERAGGFRPGAFVVVYGAGPIGLACLGLVQVAGAARVIAFDPYPKRRELALAAGADWALDPREACPHRVVLELTGGVGADVQVEASGALAQTLPEMEQSLAVNGKIVVIGRASHAVPLFLERLQRRRGQIFGAQGHVGHGNFPSVIRLLAAGRLPNARWITARYPLTQGKEVLAALRARRDEGKVLLQP